MATLSPSELLDWLAQYQFLTPTQANTLRPLLINMPDSHNLARELIRRDWVTAFQVNQILQGKHDQLVLDSYRLRERIGEGAMGQVFRAWQPRLNRIVAIKTVLKELVNSQRATERFRREMETAAQLDHPNIARVLDAGEADGRPYLVMDFIDGLNLSLRVKQRGALPIHEAVELVRQAALGLQHALERGIVHRDIKPANLIVTTGNGEGRPLVKILDFGLARYESEREQSTRLTEVGMLLGTIDYVAPEQAQNAHEADIRADIYSLGCTLFYLLTARPPFLGDTVVEKIGPRLTGEPPSVRAVRPEIAPGLEEVLRKMMARRPEDRYQTPLEMAQALAPFVMPIAQAVPVTAPVSAGVVLAIALPVPAGAIAANVPLALPIAPPTAAPAPTDGPAFLGMTASGRDVSSGPAAARPAAPTTKRPFPLRLVLILGGAAVLLSLVSCACVFSLPFFGPEKLEKKTGIVRISKAKWSMGDEKAIPGKHHHVLVWIDRVDCKGPVKITLKDLPPGVSSDELIFSPNNSSGQLRFTVSYGTEPLTKQVRLYAESETDNASADFPMTLTVKEDPFKFEK